MTAKISNYGVMTNYYDDDVGKAAARQWLGSVLNHLMSIAQSPGMIESRIEITIQ